ncbi:MAG: ferritin-like domain-containing protein [Sciscionella sp.]
MTAPSRAPLPKDTVGGLQQALAAEHAAIWTYGLLTAFLSGKYARSAASYETAHRALRDSTERLLRDSGAIPEVAAASYVPPMPVTDPASAMAVAVVAESDSATAWRAVLERTDDASLRRTALDALTSAAVRQTSWRMAVGQSPAGIALPG